MNDDEYIDVSDKVVSANDTYMYIEGTTSSIGDVDIENGMK